MASQQIRVAIIGGGLAGALLMNALTKYPQLDVQLYEAKPELQERGASVGLSVNAQRAMRLLGMENVTGRASAVKVGCLQLLVVSAGSSSSEFRGTSCPVTPRTISKYPPTPKFINHA